MKPAKLILQNFKKWKSLNVDFPENGVLIVKGPPDSGKSSVLQAIDTLFYFQDVRIATDE